MSDLRPEGIEVCEPHRLLGIDFPLKDNEHGIVGSCRLSAGVTVRACGSRFGHEDSAQTSCGAYRGRSVLIFGDGRGKVLPGQELGDFERGVLLFEFLRNTKVYRQFPTERKRKEEE